LRIGGLILVLTGMLFARSHPDYAPIIRQSERRATPAAQHVLVTAHRMVTRGVIVRGSCWDYLNAAFKQAGYPPQKRRIVFKRPKRGPYADVSRIRPGDWLYYINHSYGNIEHSGLFIGWINRARKQGLILSYGGERRNKPGRYRAYDLSSVYHIVRAGRP
jgi:hypothetical protein